MAAPSLISVTATVYSNATSPKSTASIAVQAGDILIAFAAMEHGSGGIRPTISTTTGTPTWTLQEEHAAPNADGVSNRLWSSVAGTTESIVVQFAPSSGTPFFGGEVHVWRDSDGLGNTDQNDNGTGSGSPTLTFSTTQGNSGISAGVGDWNAAGAGTWTTTAGAVVERTDFTDGAHYSVHTATYADVSAAGSKTIGLSAPTTQRYYIFGAEVKGSVSGHPTMRRWGGVPGMTPPKDGRTW